MERLKAIPISAPLYEFKKNETFFYPDSKFLMVTFSVDREDIKELVPPPLIVGKSPMVICYVAYFKDSFVGNYHEAATFIEARLKTKTTKDMGWYCNSMFVDNDAAMAAGREIYGFPKKIAEFKLFTEKGKQIGIVKRNGIEIMKIVVELTNEVNEIPGGQVIRALTLKHITNPENNGIELSEFVATDLKVIPKTIKNGSTSVEFKESKRDLIYLLKPKTDPLGFYIISNEMYLPPGKIIHKMV